MPSPLFDPENSFDNFLRRRRTDVSDQESPAKRALEHDLTPVETEDVPLKKQENDVTEAATSTTEEHVSEQETQKTLSQPNIIDSGDPTVNPGQEQAEVEERICRICFSEEDAELGKLISPCLCRGSIGLVHVQCLNEWRKSSLTTQSYFECPQCHYHYRFERTQIAGLANSKPILFTLTLFLYITLIFFSGYVATFFLSFSSSTSTTTLYDSYYYTVSKGEILDSALQTALRGVSSVIGLDLTYIIAPEEDIEEEEAYDLVLVALQDVDLDTLSYTEEGALRLRADEDGNALERAAYRLQQARLNKENKRKVVQQQRKRNENNKMTKDGEAELSEEDPDGSVTDVDTPPPLTWGTKMTLHFLLGLIFISLLSVLQILLSISFFGPLRHLTVGRRRGGGGLNLEFIVLAAVVAYGSVKVFLTCWKWTRIMVRWGLQKVETRVLEVER